MPNPIWVNKTPFLSRLITRLALGLERLFPESLVFAPVIYPVLNTDDLLATPKTQSTTKDLTGAAGTYTVYFTVPIGKRWKIGWVWHHGSTGVSVLNINRGGTSYQITGSSATSQVYTPASFILCAGDSIGRTTSGNAADSAIGLTIDYLEEDAY